MTAVSARPASLLTSQEAADFLGIGAQTLAVWRCTRRYPLAYVRVGRAIRYRLADLESFVASRTAGGERGE